jgi:hypothetical protein
MFNELLAEWLGRQRMEEIQRAIAHNGSSEQPRAADDRSNRGGRGSRGP